MRPGAGRTVEVRTADGRDVGQEEPGSYAPGPRSTPRAPGSERCAPASGGSLAAASRPTSRPLGPLQERSLLASALDAVAPGGVVAYATCSPHVAETRFVVSDVLKRRDDVEQMDARPYLRDASGEPLPDLGDGPAVQLWPHVPRHRRDVPRPPAQETVTPEDEAAVRAVEAAYDAAWRRGDVDGLLACLSPEGRPRQPAR